MYMLRSGLVRVFCVAVALSAGACGGRSVVRTESVMTRGPEGEENLVETTSVNGEVLDRLTRTWAADTLVVTGIAPVVRRYPDDVRNRALAREAALAQAQVQLAQQVGETEVTQDVTVNDMVASVAARTRLRAVLRGFFVIMERYNEPDDRYEVTLGFPKAQVLQVVRETLR